MITPNGRGLGRKIDKPDSRDKLYGLSLLETNIPSKIDLRSKLPACFDQGQTSSCGPNAGSGLMCFLYPNIKAFSRLQIYYGVRTIEDDINQDAGVETRDIFKILQVTGAAPEQLWPFEVKNLYLDPPFSVYEAAEQYVISDYLRLNNQNDYLNCLAENFPFILGFTVFETLDSDQVAKTGVLPYPVANEKQLGGHDVLAVGYDTDFYNNPDFIKSGLSKEQVSNSALLIRNSWGTDWGLNGHFWMPLDFAADPTNGGDAWTARLAQTKESKMTDVKVTGTKVDPDEIAAVKLAIKAAIQPWTYYGVSVASHVTDDELMQVATAAVAAAETYRNAPSI